MSVETDRELLELAAKAYGVRVKWEEVHGCYWVELGQGLPHEPWAPHEDDGQALRLAVKLRMDIITRVSSSETWAQAPMQRTVIVPWDGDEYAATRRAIVRAAAAIGWYMP